MVPRQSRKLLAVTALAVAFLASALAGAQHSGAQADAREMQAFFDSYLGAQMSAHHVAGAVVAVVKGDEVLLAKGYGYADVDRQISVDPNETVFILGSLTKLFTWTAVMQLVERGKLDLDVDVNSYLDFALPTTFLRPITINHLMAHAAGFEDARFAQMAASPARMTPLGSWVKTHVPARILPPGAFTAYGNYSAALAGYVVERVSGMSFDEYLDKNILGPLQMARTTSRQPPPASIAERMSQGYRFVDGRYQAQAEIVKAALNTSPAGSVTASAADVARFMIAHLNEGRFGGANLLQPSTVRQMQQRSFSNDPRVNGLAHGFWELSANGQNIIGHAGSHFIFNSLLLLFPSQRLGVFIATNSQGGASFVGENYFPFLQAFVDRQFPIPVPTLTPAVDFAQRAKRFSGSYHLTMGRSQTTPEKLFALLAVLNITADRNGIVVSLPTGNQRFVEIEPLVFRQVDRDSLIVFREDGAGSIGAGFYGPAPLTAFVKNRWFECPALHLGVLGLSIVLFLSYIISAPVISFVQRRPGAFRSTPLLGRVAHSVAVVTSLLCLLVLASAFVSVFNAVGLYQGNLPLWRFVQVGSVLVVLLGLGMVASGMPIWCRQLWSLARRVHYTLVTIATVAFVWFLYFWNLLGRGF